MVIRKIRKRDYPAVNRLLLQLHHMDVSNRPDLFSPLETYMPKDAFNSLVDNQNVFSILAQEKGQVVGCCFASLLQRSGMKTMTSAYIDLLVVDEPYRHRGIGRALFREVQTKAKKIGAQRIDLTVWDYNQTAIKAYQSYGMHPQRSVYEIHI